MARWIPPIPYGSRMTGLTRRFRVPTRPPGPDVTVEDERVNENVSLRVLRPTAAPGPVPALLWIHGGGHLLGSPEQDERSNVQLVRELGIVVAAARYRLGVDAPAPASVEDVYAGLMHLHRRAADLGVDPSRLAVGGASAGGGIAAALAQYARDRGEIPVAFQLLVYPMLDDRTVTRTDVDAGSMRMWTPSNNRLGWKTYLRAEPGSAVVPAYAVPSRTEDLSGLPPAWIGVGSLDLFHDEDVSYAERLRAAGVPCALEIVPGAFHGFDQLFANKPVVREFHRSQVEALRAAGIVG
ncbi:alpha/beta hydrolase [Enemella dayhoffiae]|uniref:Alpha/beta hydrolase n=2 Tax=Enemella dayhoffiae TaxID=2016507 RepID=A0A255GSB9_9ACTN|nr:alpha/beta hydrolase [Enemella dayhoffiae]